MYYNRYDTRMYIHVLTHTRTMTYTLTCTHIYTLIHTHTHYTNTYIFTYTNTYTVYSIVVPMGFVVIPFVDTIIFRNTFKDSLNIITNISLGFGVLVCVPSLEAQLPGFLFFMVFRALLYSTVGTYIAHTFGPLNGGRTNGMVWLIASLFNFLIYPATILEEKLGDTLFTNLNLLLLALCVPLYAIVQCYLAPVLEKVGGADRPAELGE